MNYVRFGSLPKTSREVTKAFVLKKECCPQESKKFKGS